MSGAFLLGRDPDGKDRPVGVDADGNLKVSIEGADITIDNVSIDNEVEIKNDVGNAIPTIQGFALPPYDDFDMDDPDVPVVITYTRGGDVVATVTLRYDEGGGLTGGSIAYPEV